VQQPGVATHMAPPFKERSRQSPESALLSSDASPPPRPDEDAGVETIATAMSAADGAVAAVAAVAKSLSRADVAAPEAPPPREVRREESVPDPPATPPASPPIVTTTSAPIASPAASSLQARLERGSAKVSDDPQSQMSSAVISALDSPRPGTALQGKTAYRGVKLRGFKDDGLNVLFVENTESQCQVNGRETYWSTTGDFFLYRSASTNTWGAARAKRFSQVKTGNSNGVAHSPEGFEIWDMDKSASPRPWREWDAEAGKWLTRPGAGVESRGKVRKKDNPAEKSNNLEPSAD